MFDVSMCSSVEFSEYCGSKEIIFEVSPHLLRAIPLSSVTHTMCTQLFLPPPPPPPPTEAFRPFLVVKLGTFFHCTVITI